MTTFLLLFCIQSANHIKSSYDKLGKKIKMVTYLCPRIIYSQFFQQFWTLASI